jgi:hypothetical protein
MLQSHMRQMTTKAKPVGEGDYRAPAPFAQHGLSGPLGDAILSFRSALDDADTHRLQRIASYRRMAGFAVVAWADRAGSEERPLIGDIEFGLKTRCDPDRKANDWLSPAAGAAKLRPGDPRRFDTSHVPRFIMNVARPEPPEWANAKSLDAPLLTSRSDPPLTGKLSIPFALDMQQEFDGDISGAWLKQGRSRCDVLGFINVEPPYAEGCRLNGFARRTEDGYDQAASFGRRSDDDDFAGALNPGFAKSGFGKDR